MINVLLINCGYITDSLLYKQIPLGLGYIAGCIKNYYNVRVIDFVVEKKNIEKEIKTFNPDIIGFSINILNFNITRKMVKKIKIQYPHIIIVGGGSIFSCFSSFKSLFGFDILIIGEGEYTFLELLRNIDSKKSLKNVSGIIYIEDNNKIIQNKKRSLISNLDSLPFPAWELFPYDKYKQHIIITSRGCPFQCAFCAGSKIFGKKVRFRSPMNILKEIEELINRFDMKSFLFVDDVFTINKRRAIEICNLIINENMKIKWGAMSRADHISDDLIIKMKKAGCLSLSIGIESGSQNILDLSNKKISLEEIKAAIRICKKVGVRTRTSWIIGLPGSYHEQLRSIKLIKELMPDEVIVHRLIVYPGTKLWNNNKEYGIKINKRNIKWSNYSYYNINAEIEFDYLTKNDIEKITNKIIIELKNLGYKHPWELNSNNILNSKIIATFLDEKSYRHVYLENNNKN